jgi:hypothetical protein
MKANRPNTMRRMFALAAALANAPGATYAAADQTPPESTAAP